jgi:hypothetical protein
MWWDVTIHPPLIIYSLQSTLKYLLSADSQETEKAERYSYSMVRVQE